MNIELSEIFSPLTNLGFALKGDQATRPVEYIGNYHTIKIDFLDHHSSVECDVTLTILPFAWVDFFSIIARYDRPQLESFLAQPKKLFDDEIARFMAHNLTGRCADVFKITTADEWLQLRRFHLLSLEKRNKAFGRRLTSGLMSRTYVQDSETPMF